MKRKIVRTIALGSLALAVVLGAGLQAHAQDAKAPYPNMAPVDQYLIGDRDAEIALARSAAPESISQDAEGILAGQTKAQMFESLKTALNKKELPMQEPGAMCYMLSKQQYLGDSAAHWHPHVMFFVPQTEDATWGANLAGSPVLASDAPEDRLTIFMVPVAKWSDGTADSTDKH